MLLREEFERSTGARRTVDRQGNHCSLVPIGPIQSSGSRKWVTDVWSAVLRPPVNSLTEEKT